MLGGACSDVPKEGGRRAAVRHGANFLSCRRAFEEGTGGCPSSGQPTLGVTHIGHTQAGSKQPGREEVSYLSWDRDEEGNAFQKVISAFSLLHTHAHARTHMHAWHTHTHTHFTCSGTLGNGLHTPSCSSPYAHVCPTPAQDTFLYLCVQSCICVSMVLGHGLSGF